MEAPANTQVNFRQNTLWSFWENFRFPVGVFLASRVVILLVTVAVVLRGAPPPPDGNGAPLTIDGKQILVESGSFGAQMVNVWARWDTRWYLTIAAKGFSPEENTLAFAPLYPMLVGWLAPLFGGNLLLTGLLVSNVCALGFYMLFYRLAIDDLGEKGAKAATLVLTAFPTAFFLSAAYTEGLFLLLAATAIWLGRKKHWWAAGIVGALATLSRFQGWVLTPVLLWQAAAEGDTLREVVENLRSGKKTGYVSRLIREGRIVAALLPAATFLVYGWWVKWSGLGDLTTALYGWGIRIVPPWEGFRQFLTRLAAGNFFVTDYLDLTLLVLFVVCGLAGLRRLKLELSIYFWLSLAMLFTRGTTPSLLTSFDRYLLALFPAFWVLAELRMRPRLLTVMLGVFSGVQILLCWLFLNWGWAG